MMGEHGFIEKWGILYEEVSRIPLLIKFPKSMHRGTYEAFAEIVDIMPTLLDAAGIDIPDCVQGQSLMPMLRNEAGAAKDEVFGHIFTGGLQREPALMIRKGAWKLTWYPGQEELHDRLMNDHYLKFTHMFLEDVVDGELYQLDQDPGETHNLFQDPAYAARLEAAAAASSLAGWTGAAGRP
ncbi:hypothetical protein PC120_g28061 [Phytophthora cactorum]|nr:hypothetical protein PC120_g28061 [Phytophthora cactorum]